jgi:hypothetical protein
MLSDAQRIRFFKAMNAAWAVHCQREELIVRDAAAKDAWYRAEMEREVGVRSVKDMDRVQDYDTMRLHFAIISDDEGSINYFSAAAERRLCKLISDRMLELSVLTGQPVTWPYVRAIHDRMKLPLAIEDCDTRALRMLFQALDTQVRRQRRDEPLPF